MKQFFKFMFASALGVFISGVVLFILFFFVLAGITASIESKTDKKTVSVKDNSILHLTFANQIVDKAEKNPFEDIDLGPFSSSSKDGLDKILKSIENATKDDKIKGIFLESAYFPGGLAQMEEVRNALIDFKSSGKWIVAYSEAYSQGGYYLSSVADKVYLYPEGALDFKGLSTKIAFLKGMLEKLDIEAQIIRGPDNKYKSAVEPYMYDKMSDDNRKQLSELLSSVWSNMLVGIETSRGVKADQLQMIADSLLIRSTSDAVEYGFIDAAKYRDEVIAELMNRVEVEEEKDLKFISYSKYKRHKPKIEGEKKSYQIKDKVAVVFAEGSIMSGESEDGVMGSKTIVKAIKKARKDTTVKAIVLRVNSPGGSALASDVMWRETMLAKKEKPLIVSMGNLAASGGYYISAGADRIFADNHTITGSIGVFGMLPNLEGMMENKLGVKFDQVGTGAHADWGDALRSLDGFEMGAIQEMITQTYDTFLLRVAKGRGMTVEEVDAVAQGRVWTGSDAVKKGLVDEIGGLEEAIVYAAEQAGVEDYKIKSFPLEKDPFEEMFKSFSAEIEASFLKDKLGKNYVYLQRIEELQNIEGIQARLPFYLNIE